MDLSLERFSHHKDGVYVIHERVKQNRQSFLVPRGSTGKMDWAKILETYLANVH